MHACAVLLDLDGVFYVGDAPIPGGAVALAELRRRDIACLLVTNTTSRPRSTLVTKLADLGIEVRDDEILTPTVAAAHWIREHRAGPVAAFVDEATAVDLGDAERLPADADSGAGAVVVGDLGDAWDFATLNRAFRLLMAEPRPPLIALGMTRFWKAPDGLRLDTAPFVAALEHAADTRATVLGKPSPGFFRAALEALGADARTTIMVGDDIRTDVGAAQAAGIRGVLVRTGKFHASDLDGAIAPDTVIDSIADLPALLDPRA